MVLETGGSRQLALLLSVILGTTRLFLAANVVYLSQRDNFKLVWLPFLVLMKKFELAAISFRLENRVFQGIEDTQET